MSNIIIISPVLILSLTALLIVAAYFLLKNMSDLWVYILFGLGAATATYCVYFLWNEGSQAFDGLYIADNFALIITSILLLNLLLCWLIAMNKYERSYLIYAEFTASLIFATVGMILMASSTNLLLIFLGFEILSISLYFLVGMKKDTVVSIEAAIKYLLIGVFSSAFVLYGIAFLFGASGSLELSAVFANGFTFDNNNGFFTTGMLLIIIGLGFRISFVPLHLWSADVYQGASTPVTAFMISGVATSVFAVLLRLFDSLPMAFSVQWIVTLSVIAILTILIGNVLAISQKDIKKMLIYSALAHGGYILVGLIAKNNLGSNSIVFYLLVFTLMNAGVWAALTFFSNPQKEFTDIAEFKGLVYKHPLVAFLIAGFIVSLAGLPPLSGFIGKLYIMTAAVKSGYIFLVVFSIIGSLIALYYYFNFINIMFMRKEQECGLNASNAHTVLVVLIVTAIATIYLSFFPSYFFSTLERFATLP